MVVLNNEILKQIDELGKADQTSMIGDLVINYIGSKNSCENLTLALESIKEDLKELLSYYPEIAYFGQIHFNLLSGVIKELGWIIHEFYYDTVSMNGNIRIKVIVPYKDFGYYIYCSKVKPFTEIRKFKLNEKKSNNC